MTINNPVRLRCASGEAAARFAAEVRTECGAPTDHDGIYVILPGDQPGFLFHVLAHAVATDVADSAEAIRVMEAGL